MVDIPDDAGWTPLLWAASRRDMKMAQLLVSKGADPNQRTAVGANACHLAAYNKDTRMIDLFRENHADIHMLDPQGRTVEDILMGLGSETEGASMTDTAREPPLPIEDVSSASGVEGPGTMRDLQAAD